MLKARLLGTLAGGRVFRVPVLVKFNSSTLYRTIAELKTEVIARSAAEAANFIRDRFADRPETEVFAYGPQGGKTYRYIGWESAIGHALWAPRGASQLRLFREAI